MADQVIRTTAARGHSYMQDLHLVGFTKDHRHLIFSARKGAKSGSYVVPVDAELVEAVQQVADRAVDDGVTDPEPAPSQPRVESQLSVREVQARLRAGDSVSDVASDAGVEPAWVERFTAPILAEQRRIVDRALAVPLTRARAGQSAVPLRRAVAAAMAERDIEFTADGFESAWSARLVGGDEWVVAFAFPNRGRTRRLEWNFDAGTATLTTTDRFASQLAFVDSADSLPPADTTVGALPTRTSSSLHRGALTSGGLARPGSGRVTTPSGSAAPMASVVRPTPPPDPSPRPAPVPARPVRESAVATPPPPAMPPVRHPEPSAVDRSRPERQPLPEPVPERRPVPAAQRSIRPTPVPERRPAPVAAETNATRSFTRRPVPGMSGREPVVDDGAGSYPSAYGESVVILRPADDEERPGAAVRPRDVGDVIEREPLADVMHDDHVHDDVDAYEDDVYEDDDAYDDDLHDTYDGVDLDDDPDEGHRDDGDSGDEEFDEFDDTHVDDESDDTDDTGAAVESSITLKVSRDDAAPEVESTIERAPIRLLRRVQAEPVEADERDLGELDGYQDDDGYDDDSDEYDDDSDEYAYDDDTDEYEYDDEYGYDDDDEYGDDTDEADTDEAAAESDDDVEAASEVVQPDRADEPAPPRRRSTVQIRPGSAAPAQRSTNGRRRPLQAGVDSPPVDEQPSPPAEESERPVRARRRRREPLRAR